MSGSLKDRPALLRLLEYAEEHRDMNLGLVFLRLDRLSRSLKDLLSIMEKIDAAGAGFRSLTEAIDTDFVARLLVPPSPSLRLT